MENTFKVIIAGSRSFNCFETLENYCNYILQNKNSIEIVSGNAIGADRLGEEYAKKYGLKLKIFKPDWDKYGKSAGYIRNVDMANYADAAIIFWNKKSRGSKHMIDISKKLGLSLRIYKYEL